MSLRIAAIKLLVPNPSNAFVVSLIYAVDATEFWPLRVAYLGAAYGVEETGRIDRSRERGAARFPDWALQLFRNDLIENERHTNRTLHDVWEASWDMWLNWQVIYGMVSALESGHKLLLTRKD